MIAAFSKMAACIIRPHKSRSMICSMTGYAAATRDLPVASLAAELKSVNGRFLDVQFRLPDELRAVEPMLRELIQARVGRGKVECRVSVTPPAGAAPQISVNEALLAALAEASRKVRTAIPDSQPLRVGEALHWPGVLGDDRSARVREACVALVREVLGGADEERIRQEIALFGVKADVAEELNRLGAHLEEVHRVVSAGGTVGKRLDFLMQELNREANTLGSKSVSKELSDAR